MVLKNYFKRNETSVRLICISYKIYDILTGKEPELGWYSPKFINWELSMTKKSLWLCNFVYETSQKCLWPNFCVWLGWILTHWRIGLSTHRWFFKLLVRKESVSRLTWLICLPLSLNFRGEFKDFKNFCLTHLRWLMSYHVVRT